MTVRRALSVGVARFDRHEQLDFVPELVRRVGEELSGLGYDVRTSAAQPLNGRELGEQVTRSLTGGVADDLSVVHVLSHGDSADGDATVFALGTDGDRHGEASIAHWLTMTQSNDGPKTLFLLDLCEAGTAARFSWQTRLEGLSRAWVIAACGPRQTAYDGRFTEAVITVLKALRAGELDIDPSWEFAPLSTIARAIRQEVNRLTRDGDGFHQQVTASLVDLSADDAPLYVVTGGPGSGKSALLGVLVCAASRLLRSATEPVWHDVAQAPVPVDDFAAVHARQRGLAGIVSSIARQLGLPENLPADKLVTALRKRRPVIVVDALDEADGPVSIIDNLLVPLIAPAGPVRLLVGVRRYDDYAPLFANATVIDLDEVEQDVLEDDLFTYVVNLLRATPTYRARAGRSPPT